METRISKWNKACYFGAEASVIVIKLTALNITEHITQLYNTILVKSMSWSMRSRNKAYSACSGPSAYD